MMIGRFNHMGILKTQIPLEQLFKMFMQKRVRMVMNFTKFDDQKELMVKLNASYHMMRKKEDY